MFTKITVYKVAETMFQTIAVFKVTMLQCLKKVTNSVSKINSIYEQLQVT